MMGAMSSAPAERPDLAVTGAQAGWRPSEAIEALDTLLQVSDSTLPALARRAHLSESEMRSLRHFVTEDLGPAELARVLGISSAAATGIVDRLEARGHVERLPHDSDRRRTVVRLTDSGMRETLTLLQPMFQGLADLDARLTDEERVVVTRFLRDATSALKALL